jgi:hypothetical protein
MPTFQLREARRLMRYLQSLPVGTTVLLDGVPVQVQYYPGELFGHPDNKKALKLGYGVGRFNREISVADIAHRFAKIELPGG